MRYKKLPSYRSRLPLKILMSLVLMGTLGMGCLIAVMALRVLQAFQQPDNITLQDVTIGINIFWTIVIVWIAMFVLLALGIAFFKRKEF